MDYNLISINTTTPPPFSLCLNSCSNTIHYTSKVKRVNPTEKIFPLLLGLQYFVAGTQLRKEQSVVEQLIQFVHLRLILRICIIHGENVDYFEVYWIRMKWLYTVASSRFCLQISQISLLAYNISVKEVISLDHCSNNKWGP